MISLIFDLDQTLVDSSSAEASRQSRNWPQTYTLIPNFIIYDGLADLFQYIRDQGIKVCIVTTSPSIYCQKVLDHWKIPYDSMVCYHDVKYRKPHPESFIKALEKLNAHPKDVLSLGDREIDIQASKAANIKSIGCLWGSAERDSITAAQPDHLAELPSEALEIIRAFQEKYKTTEIEQMTKK
ncbi:HAD family hydrolase [Larkinella sp. GY13]|uniref:HAD family hydrolase n=1 Tax=Larkinella sp. GY13 TaxID=3453720 RepID=UPI003EEA0B4E